VRRISHSFSCPCSQPGCGGTEWCITNIDAKKNKERDEEKRKREEGNKEKLIFLETVQELINFIHERNDS
jgi:hypothetical protein